MGPKPYSRAQNVCTRVVGVPLPQKGVVWNPNPYALQPAVRTMHILATRYSALMPCKSSSSTPVALLGTEDRGPLSADHRVFVQWTQNCIYDTCAQLPRDQFGLSALKS